MQVDITDLKNQNTQFKQKIKDLLEKSEIESSKMKEYQR